MKAALAKLFASAGLKLTGAAGWLVSILLEFVADRVIAFVKKKIEEKRRREEIQKEVEKSVEPLKKAETADEIDKATDSALDGF